MRALLQRVRRAAVTIAGHEPRTIGPGLVILLGIRDGDGPEEVAYLADKCRQLRIFEDDAGKMNRSLEEAGGAALVISQFTLHADTRKGRRPSFLAAARPDVSEPLYEAFVAHLRERGLTVQTGEFGAEMLVDIANDGPVTILLESKNEWA